MATQTALQAYTKIEKLINSSRFQEAFFLLKNRMQIHPGLTRELERLKHLESTYRYMLDYISEGHSDPSQKEMMDQIRDNLKRGNDLLIREEQMIDSSDQYSSTRRMINLRGITLPTLITQFVEIFSVDNPENSGENIKISQSQARLLDEIFNYIWTMFGSDSKDYEEIDKTLKNPDFPDYLKSLIISSLILGNITYFEPEALEILFSQYENSDSLALKARAITGFILLSILHSRRIEGNINLRSRLMLAKEEESLQNVVKEILMNLLRTYDTQRIDSKMRNEVIPGLMKIKPEIIDKMRNLASDSENFLSDGNPQWEDLIENSEIGDKLREINDMQMEGADVMVTAFSNLKGFPFFYQISNWFIPFTPGHYEYSQLPIGNDKESLDRFTMVMCDSDLHSFLLSMATMPQERREQMINTMQHQMKEVKEAMSGAIGETEKQILSRKIRHTLQDLYRFFKFYRKKNEFKDPFGSPFLIDHIQPLVPILDIPKEDIKVMAEFYFKHKYFDEAVGFFEFIDKEEPGNFNLWEKIGYSHDRMARYDNAIEWYQKAQLINPGNAWLEKKLAVALKNSGRRDEAIEYYNKALLHDPENYHLIMSAAQCLMDKGDYKEALHHFYHAHYLKPDKLDVQRAIAWTELLSGNYDKASSLYQKILENPKSDRTDILNAAHSALAAHDFKKALKYYTDFVNKDQNHDITSLVIALRDDSDSLRKLGIKTGDLRLIVDKIRYDQIGN